ncbi:MAG: hypothetical protein II420_05860, partial [Oscillospiraceae bacterium]|nr:hypothetical protein [Oscillospiraceae bacterium]
SLLQDEMHMSYPAAKKQLSALLEALDLAPQEQQKDEEGIIDMRSWNTDSKSTKASEIIKTKLKEAGGRAVVHSINGNAYELKAEADGRSFSSEAIRLSQTTLMMYLILSLIFLWHKEGKPERVLGEMQSWENQIAKRQQLLEQSERYTQGKA